MLKFFGDDSFGRNAAGAQGCCVVAGYLTDSTAWNAIERKWRVALDAAPKIDYFRMHEYVSRCNGVDDESGQFLNLPKPDANRKFDSLVSILEKHGHSFGWLE